jgi:hypothetical protein
MLFGKKLRSIYLKYLEKDSKIEKDCVVILRRGGEIQDS